MKRSDLEKRAIDELSSQGYTCERAYNKAVYVPSRGYIASRFDFFHVVDIIALKESRARWIQVTSENADPKSKHHSRNGSDSVYLHKKKIEEFWPFDLPLELWTYNKDHNRWTHTSEIYYKKQWKKDTLWLIEMEGEQ